MSAVNSPYSVGIVPCAGAWFGVVVWGCMVGGVVWGVSWREAASVEQGNELGVLE